MNIVVATWSDEYNQIFRLEFYKEDINVQALLTYYKNQKQMCGKSVIAEYLETLVFSDGNRVELTLHPIEKGVPGEENTIDVKTSPLRIAS